MTQQVHTLKVVSAYWPALKAGLKNFEVRRDDRGFQKGDVLELLHCKADGRTFVGPDGKLFGNSNSADVLRFQITYILTGGQFGIEPGYVVMGIERCL